MNDKITSPVSVASGDVDTDDLPTTSDQNTPRVQPVNLRAQWSGFFSFLKRPHLPEQKRGGLGGQTIATFRMLVLDLIAMSLLMAVAGAVMVFGFEIPRTALAEIEITAAIVFAVVLVAPLLEELVFRSWLSGRPRYLIGFPIALIAGVGAAMAGANSTGDQAEIALGAAMLGGIVLYMIAAAMLWKRQAPAWFRTIFVAMFWLSTLAFAAIHLLNFSEGNLAALLPLILPQFILGTMLGYLRVNYGLWTAIALHMLHNGLIISLVLAATKAAS